MSETAAPAETKHEPAAHGADGHGNDLGHIFAHAKVYIWIGVILFIATAVTVALSYFDFAEYAVFRGMFNVIGVHGIGINIIIGLLLATGKVCLVGLFFMHLKGEKRTIWRPLCFTFFFVAGLFLLCLLAFSDPIPTTSHWHH